MALTDYYVTDAGAGTGSGTSIANAMSFATFVDYMSTGGSFTASPGDRFNIIGTITGRTTTTDTFVNGGTATSPVIIRGWTSGGTTPYAGRTNTNGPLITTNFPVITYTTGRMSITGSFIILQYLNISGNPSNPLVTFTADSAAVNCAIANSSTNSLAIGISLTLRDVAFDCDVSLTGASGGTCAIRLNGVGTIADSNRVTVTSTSADGIRSVTTGSMIAYGNTVYTVGGVGISTTSTSAYPFIRNNTIYGSTGDGIDIVTGTTARQYIVGNMITDNGGFGVDLNAASVAAFIAYNRTRDNTSGAYNSGTDWVTATSFGNVTTDTGGASTDYVNAGSGDFNLIAASPGTSASISQYASMGALQRNQASSGGVVGRLVNSNNLVG